MSGAVCGRALALQGMTLNEIYDRLEQLDSDSAEARAAMVLAGLGFDAKMQLMKTREFSGAHARSSSTTAIRFGPTRGFPDHRSTSRSGGRERPSRLARGQGVPRGPGVGGSGGARRRGLRPRRPSAPAPP